MAYTQYRFPTVQTVSGGQIEMRISVDFPVYDPTTQSPGGKWTGNPNNGVVTIARARSSSSDRIFIEKVGPIRRVIADDDLQLVAPDVEIIVHDDRTYSGTLWYDGDTSPVTQTPVEGSLLAEIFASEDALYTVYLTYIPPAGGMREIYFAGEIDIEQLREENSGVIFPHSSTESLYHPKWTLKVRDWVVRATKGTVNDIITHASDDMVGSQEYVIPRVSVPVPPEEGFPEGATMYAEVPAYGGFIPKDTEDSLIQWLLNYWQHDVRGDWWDVPIRALDWGESVDVAGFTRYDGFAGNPFTIGYLRGCDWMTFTNLIRMICVEILDMDFDPDTDFDPAFEITAHVYNGSTHTYEEAVAGPASWAFSIHHLFGIQPMGVSNYRYQYPISFSGDAKLNEVIRWLCWEWGCYPSTAIDQTTGRTRLRLIRRDYEGDTLPSSWRFLGAEAIERRRRKTHVRVKGVGREGIVQCPADAKGGPERAIEIDIRLGTRAWGRQEEGHTWHITDLTYNKDWSWFDQDLAFRRYNTLIDNGINPDSWLHAAHVFVFQDDDINTAYPSHIVPLNGTWRGLYQARTRTDRPGVYSYERSNSHLSVAQFYARQLTSEPTDHKRHYEGIHGDDGTIGSVRVGMTTSWSYRGDVTSFHGVDIEIDVQNNLTSVTWRRSPSYRADDIIPYTYINDDKASGSAASGGTTTAPLGGVASAPPSASTSISPLAVAILADTSIVMDGSLTTHQGVTLVDGMIVWANGQSDATTRGPYIVSLSGPWARFDVPLYGGWPFSVDQGTYANTTWTIDGAAGRRVVGTDGVTAVQVGAFRATADGTIGTTHDFTGVSVQSSDGSIAVTQSTVTSGGRRTAAYDLKGTFTYACAYVGTTNVTPSGSRTVDGATPSTGTYVLLVGQSTTSQNGPWIVDTTGSWTRPAWQFKAGMRVQILYGSAYPHTSWVLGTEGVIVGTTGQAWYQDGSGIIYTTGTHVGVNTLAPSAALHVLTIAGSDTAVQGETLSGTGGYFSATSGQAVYAIATTGAAVTAIASSGIGVAAQSTSSTALSGQSTTGSSVVGFRPNGASSNAATAPVAQFDNYNSSNTAGSGLRVTHAGAGKAIEAISVGIAVSATCSGSSVAVSGVTTGTGAAVSGYRPNQTSTNGATVAVGYFENANTSNREPAVEAVGAAGPAIYQNGTRMRRSIGITGSYTMADNDDVLEVGTISGAITITVLTPSTWVNIEREIWDVAGSVSGTKTVTLARPSGATWSFRGGAAGTGATSVTIMNAAYTGCRIWSNGTDVFIR